MSHNDNDVIKSEAGGTVMDNGIKNCLRITVCLFERGLNLHCMSHPESSNDIILDDSS